MQHVWLSVISRPSTCAACLMARALHGTCTAWHVRCMARALHGTCAAWHVHCSSHGTCAAWHVHCSSHGTCAAWHVRQPSRAHVCCIPSVYKLIDASLNVRPLCCYACVISFVNITDTNLMIYMLFCTLNYAWMCVTDSALNTLFVEILEVVQNLHFVTVRTYITKVNLIVVDILWLVWQHGGIMQPFVSNTVIVAGLVLVSNTSSLWKFCHCNSQKFTFNDQPKLE